MGKVILTFNYLEIIF